MASKGKFTAGPWRLSDNSAAGLTGNDGSVTIISEAFAICDVRLTKHYPHGKTYKAADEQRDANARLIAAAPELLAALKGVVKIADRATVEFDAARAAIAKATSTGSPHAE